MIEWLKSWCKCEKEIEFDDQTIEVLRAIYNETAPSTDEEDSEDEDYTPPEEESDDEVSTSESEPDDDPDSNTDEEIIIKRDSEGHYYLF